MYDVLNWKYLEMYGTASARATPRSSIDSRERVEGMNRVCLNRIYIANSSTYVIPGSVVTAP
jgi:hypothetical protein